MMGVSKAERMRNAEKLGVTESDIDRLNTNKRMDKLVRTFLLGLAPLAGLILGYAIGTAVRPEVVESTYPLAIGAAYANSYERTKPTVAGAIILAILALVFMSVLTSGMVSPNRPAIMYSVYSAEQ